jgi:glycosyltransferase involved in cell wall biosynthesis
VAHPSETLVKDEGWPRISIVTPSYNQAQFLEETIRSVLLQSYPHLEFIVVDGGSTDGSIRILEKYAPWLTSWCSERDRGQSDAINKGLARCTGELFNWLNSDDVLCPGALHSIGARYRSSPGSMIAGVGQTVDERGTRRTVAQAHLTLEAFLSFWADGRAYHQPSLFFPRQAVRAAGGVDVDLHFAMDHRLMLAVLSQGVPVAYLDSPVATFRTHQASKSTRDKGRFLGELCDIAWKHRALVPADQWPCWRRKLAYFASCASVQEVCEGSYRAALRRLALSAKIAPWIAPVVVPTYALKLASSAPRRFARRVLRGDRGASADAEGVR